MPTFYRAILSDTPTALDFTSNRAKGKPRREPFESVEEWSGISVYDAVAKGGHCNLWGEPEEFLGRMIVVTPVEAAKGGPDGDDV